MRPAAAGPAGGGSCGAGGCGHWVAAPGAAARRWRAGCGERGRRGGALAGLRVLAICVQGVLTRYAYVAGKILGETVLAEFRENFVDSVLDLPLSTVERAGSGDLINRASRDVAALRLAAQEG